MNLLVELHLLNAQAYSAAKAARAAKSPLADQLRTMALETDKMVDEYKEPK